MYVTARLQKDGKTLSEGVKFKSEGYIYKVSREHESIVGPELYVIAGPHGGPFDTKDVYTVELLAPPQGADSLPYFNSSMQCCWEYVNVIVDGCTKH